MPIIPIGIEGAREVMPPEARFPKLRMPVTIRFGEPILAGRYTDRPDDHLALRQITDEVMFAIRQLSGQDYVNEYANKKKRAEPEASEQQVTEAPETEAAETEAVTSEPAARSAATNGRSAAERDDDLAFVSATDPRSSADVLRRPVRRNA